MNVSGVYVLCVSLFLLGGFQVKYGEAWVWSGVGGNEVSKIV
jgi:hypothetical protein